MKLPRAIGFGIMSWVIIFVVISILMFLPYVKDHTIVFYIIYYILLVPIVLFLAKWYFKKDNPTVKKGLTLGIIGLVVGSVLDMIITIPLFIIPQGGSYGSFFGDWRMYIGYAIFLIFAMYSGYEFDSAYSGQEEKKEN